jgi:hypothetical protein
MNILNPLALADFIKSWKRGDYKKEKIAVKKLEQKIPTFLC